MRPSWPKMPAMKNPQFHATRPVVCIGVIAPFQIPCPGTQGPFPPSLSPPRSPQIHLDALRISTNRDRLRRGVAGLQHLPSPCCIAGAGPRRLGRLVVQGQHRQRSPIVGVMSEEACHYYHGKDGGRVWLTSAGLPTSLRASQRKGFSKL